jgi:hypothetical protein
MERYIKAANSGTIYRVYYKIRGFENDGDFETDDDRLMHSINLKVPDGSSPWIEFRKWVSNNGARANYSISRVYDVEVLEPYEVSPGVYKYRKISE